MGVGGAVLVESALSFLGLGVQPPTPSWGSLLSSGKDNIEIAWWLSAFPGLAILITVLAINLIGDAAAFDGWGEEGVASAARAQGIDPDIALLAFPGGAMDAISAWIASVDEAMAKAHPAESLAELPVRERIHSSEVSSVLASSVLVTILSGR